MEKYIKWVLYAYPSVKELVKGYEEHIKNCAVLSYRGNRTAEETALYLAEEILEKRRLEWLISCVEEVLDKLSDMEKLLVQIRYFGKERKIKKRILPVREKGYENWSESKYFRAQNRLGIKLNALFSALGLTQEIFEKEYLGNEIFRRVKKLMEQKDDNKIHNNERAWLRLESNLKT